MLERLDRQHPDVKFPERMLKRLEMEQTSRRDLEFKRIENEAYELETIRLGQQGGDALVREAGRRAFAVLIVLLVVGVGLEFTGHEVAGNIVLGTTIVGVVGAFIAQQVRRRKN